MSADPGGNFASDAHRRVMANLPNPDDAPTDVDGLLGRIAQDDYLELDAEELGEILADLEADGDAAELKDGWKNTKSGYAVLTGPIAEDGGRAHE